MLCLFDVELFYETAVKRTLGNENADWSSIMIMFDLVWLFSRIIVDSSYLSYSKKTEILTSMADGCYWAVKDTDRPVALSSYVSKITYNVL